MQFRGGAGGNLDPHNPRLSPHGVTLAGKAGGRIVLWLGFFGDFPISHPSRAKR